MDLPDLKKLNKLVALCRKQGIKVFELGEMKITLTDDAPQRARNEFSPRASKASVQGNTVADSLPSDEDLLFASCGGNEGLDLTGIQ